MSAERIREWIGRYAVPGVSTGFVFLLLYQAYTMFLGRALFTVYFVLFALLVSTLNFIRESGNSIFKIIREKRLLWIGALLMVMASLSTLYLAWNFTDLTWRAGSNTTADYVFGLMLIIPVMMMAWKKGGLFLILLILLSLFYMFFGKAFPGMLKHGGFTLKDLLVVQVLALSDSGLFSAATQVVATWVAIFIVYAGIIQGYGAFDSIFKCSLVLCRKKLDLIPQIPILVSLLFGSISGAASANVGATGSFTIPLMKRYNLPPTLAGGIEAVASSGGQVMPPVMGATGFLMAMLLGVTYIDVMLVGIIPALLFYWVFAFGVYVATRGLVRLPGNDVDEADTRYDAEAQKITGQDILNLVPLALSVSLMLICLIYLRMEVLQAALYGIISFAVTQFIKEILFQRHFRTLVDFGKKFVRGASIGCSVAANVGAMVAGMALLLKALTATALAPKISYMMVDVGKDSVIVLLLLIWVISLMFGMAVSTLIVYLLVVVLAVPALEALGIAPMISHFIIFYFAAISMITPPTAPASLVAAGIAEDDFLQTSFQAIRVGLPLFILPFTFFTYPELILVNPHTWYIVCLAAVGFMGISYSLNYPGIAPRDMIYRILTLIGGVFVSFHGFFYSDGKMISGFVAVAIIGLIIKNLTKREALLAGG